MYVTVHVFIFTPITDNNFDGFLSSLNTWEPQSEMLTLNSKSSQPSLKNLSLAMRLTCLLCPYGQKPFKSFEVMKNHLLSSAHLLKVFHCSLYFAELKDDRSTFQLMRYFLTISSLMQHVKSGACQGGCATFQKTVKYMKHNLRKMRLWKLRLLN